MLKDKLPITQEEFNDWVERFELDKRVILTYGNLDEKFIRNYLKRKKIWGTSKLKFENMKHHIISSSFSTGEISKDNLCTMLGIEGVSKIHSGLNDCILEWKLFEKMDNKFWIVTDCIHEYYDIFELSENYLFPVSYITHFPNVKYFRYNIPDISVNYECIKRIKIKFNHNRDVLSGSLKGITIEQLLNNQLQTINKDAETLQICKENKKHLKRLGHIDYSKDILYYNLLTDGTIQLIGGEDKQIRRLGEKISPVVKFIKNNIFYNENIYQHETVINTEDKVLAINDFSSDTKILEFKTYDATPNSVRYQAYYESRGREAFLLTLNLENMRYVEFCFYKLNFEVTRKSKSDKKSFEIINLDTKECFSNIDAAADYIKIEARKIRNAVTGRQKTAGGYHWMYYEDYVKQYGEIKE